MADYTQLTPDLAVAPQLRPDDLADLARAGFRVVINNRPDGEAEDQPDHLTMERAAREAGLTYHYQPVVASEIDDQDARRFAELVDRQPGPVLAFCRTGNRCGKLWERARQLRE
ncbi:TIGR01244 family sulfur transferase [Alloalcanivorax marinus]|uniref:TIGR01244 family sulfur transferase n=1 Tax=Alloalcanivorax marinus TaxID=1177169 RepID=UPI0019330D99|nr:TIGR01244 family sulfur transferase [Alloalcanivorax marinus]MBL7250262.1 TIGR01244 family phosphatase [Alloalcanivorax marinus]